MSLKKDKNKWSLVTEYPITAYQCGLKAGDKLCLKKDLTIKDSTGKPTKEIYHVGEIWTVLSGSNESPIDVWLRRPDGGRHTWDNDPSIFETFEIIRDDIFDIVNERDEVIGQKLRREVHRDGDKHRAVHVLVFNSQGEVFLQKRSMTKDTFPGTWDSSSSGHVDSGEDYDTCAIRELREEIGLVVKNCPTRLFKIDACADTGQEFVWVYREKYEGPFILHPEEIERGDWFKPEQVTEWIAKSPQDFATAFVFIWKKLGH